MPLYAYRCADCRHEFETLARFEETPECPACGGVRSERQLARIAKPASGVETGEGACAAMTGGEACPSCPAFAGSA